MVRTPRKKKKKTIWFETTIGNVKWEFNKKIRVFSYYSSTSHLNKGGPSTKRNQISGYAQHLLVKVCFNRLLGLKLLEIRNKEVAWQSVGRKTRRLHELLSSFPFYSLLRLILRCNKFFLFFYKWTKFLSLFFTTTTITLQL